MVLPTHGVGHDSTWLGDEAILAEVVDEVGHGRGHVSVVLPGEEQIRVPTQHLFLRLLQPLGRLITGESVQ